MRLNDHPKITSSLWKQLSEERNRIGLKLPSFTDNNMTEDTGEHEGDTSFSPFKYQDVWKVPSDTESDVLHSDVQMRTPWESLTSKERSCPLPRFLDSSSPKAGHFDSIENDLYRESDKENAFPVPPKAVGYERKAYDAYLDKKNSVPLSKEFQMQQHGLPNVWGAKSSFDGSSQAIPGSDSYGLHLGDSKPWEAVSLSSRPALRDVSNQCYSVPSAHQKNNFTHIQTPTDFSSLSSSPFSAPAHASYCNQEPTYNYQSQRQHTGNL